MITVVEFRAKQPTGSRYMPTDKLYANYFFIKINLDLLKHAKNWAQFQKTECFKNENNQQVSLIKVIFLISNSSMKKKIETNSADFWHRKMTLKTKNLPPFAYSDQSKSILIKKIIVVWFISEHTLTPCSLFGPKLHNCNHANSNAFVMHLVQ